jgi:hypothetical protein
MKIILGIVSACLLSCFSALGYTLNQSTKTVTTDGSSSDVQGAIGAASDGWTVLVPSGSFSWSGISISGKGIWLRGVGAASTTVSGSININKDSTHAVEVSGINFASGNPKIRVMGSWNAKPVIVHDCTFNENGTASFLFEVNGGLIYNCTFTGSGNYNDQAVKVKINSNVENQWTSPDTLGNHDSGGDKNVYVEDCAFARMPYQAFDFDGCSRMVVRNCTFTDSAITSHGADTGPISTRHYEIYNNRFIFSNFGDCDGSLTPPLDYFMFIRGGTGCIYSNTTDNLSSCAWGNKSEIKLTVYNITRNGGQVPCQTSYPAYQQIGQGHNGSTYFTDPLYIWGNSTTAGVGIFQYSPDECGNGQQIGNYIRLNRDYFLSARPGYTGYAYPHPLRGSSAGPPAPAPPTGLRIISG